MDLSTITTRTARRVDVLKLKPSSKIWLLEQIIFENKTTLELHEKNGISMKLYCKNIRENLKGKKIGGIFYHTAPFLGAFRSLSPSYLIKIIKMFS